MAKSITPKKLRDNSKFSRSQMIAAIFGVSLVGSILLLRSFAASPEGPSNLNNPPVQREDIMGSEALDPSHLPNHSSADVAVDYRSNSYLANYVHKLPFPIGHAVAGQPVIVAISYTTSSRVASILNGKDPGLPGSAMVYYVREKGPFKLDNISVPPGASAPTYTFGDRVFDAKTGNLIMYSAEN